MVGMVDMAAVLDVVNAGAAVSADPDAVVRPVVMSGRLS
jgi:hypothetical protein